MFGRIETGKDRRGIIDTEIPYISIDFYTARLLGVGTDVKVESPPELVGAVRERVRAVAELYTRNARPEADRRATLLRRSPSENQPPGICIVSCESATVPFTACTRWPTK